MCYNSITIENPVDAILKTKPLVASGDAIIRDECDRWFNLVSTVIAQQIGSYPYIDFTAGIYASPPSGI